MATFNYGPNNGYKTFTVGEHPKQPNQNTPQTTSTPARTGNPGTGYIYDPVQQRVVWNGPSMKFNPAAYAQNSGQQQVRQPNQQQNAYGAPGFVQRFFDTIAGVHTVPAVQNLNWNPANGLPQMYHATPTMMNSWWGRTQYNNQADQLRNGKVYNYEGREIHNVPQMVVDNFLRTINKMNGV